MPRPTVVCLTPVRNEAWILERFLRCASLWADHIVVCDEHSEDGSQNIARAFPKVRLIDHRSPSFDEAGRQSRLIDEARRIPGPRLLMALDADEFLAADALASPSWQEAVNVAPGTVLRFRHSNLFPGLRRCWQPREAHPWGFADDGSAHHGLTLHSPRVPVPSSAPERICEAIPVLHYQYTDWSRMAAKQRWYQCLEAVLWPERSVLDIYRRYHHMDAVARTEQRPVRRGWISGYEAEGIDMTTVHGGPPYWFEREVVLMMERHGAERFRRLAIWDSDWSTLAGGWNLPRPERFRDPRTRRERVVHRWLRQTQRWPRLPTVARAERWLRRRGW
ncbi:MAG: glycosyltransferase family 2 protein [Acidobacteriota bacterium]